VLLEALSGTVIGDELNTLVTTMADYAHFHEDRFDWRQRRVFILLETIRAEDVFLAFNDGLVVVRVRVALVLGEYVGYSDEVERIRARLMNLVLMKDNVAENIS
jgi:hypothetical protein